MKQIMRILVFSFAALGLLAANVYADDLLYPQEDFNLISGVYRVNNPEDPAPVDKIYRAIFRQNYIHIKDGKLSESPGTQFSFTMGDQEFSGEVSMSIDGTYDKDTGMIRGTYKIVDASSYIHSKGQAKGRTGWGKGSESGTLQGQVIRDHVVLNFACKSGSGEYYNQLLDGKEESGTKSTCNYFFHKVAYEVFIPPKIQPTPTTSKAVPHKPDSGTRFAGITGQVEWRNDDDPEGWRLVKLDTVIPVGAHIKTDDDSSAILSFADMSTFNLKAGSEVVVESPPEKDSKIKLVAGNVWANIKKMVKDGTMEMEMNQAVAGIKGTTFVCEENNGKSTLKVLDGTVDFKLKKTGEVIQIKGGEKIEADANGPSLIAKFDTSDEIESWIVLNEPDWSKLDQEEQQPQQQHDEQQPQKTATRYILPITGIIVLLAAILGFKLIKLRGGKREER